MARSNNKLYALARKAYLMHMSRSADGRGLDPALIDSVKAGDLDADPYITGWVDGHVSAYLDTIRVYALPRTFGRVEKELSQRGTRP